ncbi:hypothetical protein H310_13719 [Aphanomyces invadans]|uniref:AMP-dependent synthetase/ligase domain-containing protein n=1 Tax=Aphanomyces invadans TaxID=157072 RepID=A0A024TF43_9STRA|nr:hypothetical protein H310_13719 [Aphanomyces invadans]ETV91932.1 hypothetical protein H310_13719 [Aphanomyces invadans]|eukprot:XP_008879569.1 hypothetical protein H310_13719 [Aphanomyces invadans]
MWDVVVHSPSLLAPTSMAFLGTSLAVAGVGAAAYCFLADPTPSPTEPRPSVVVDNANVKPGHGPVYSVGSLPVPRFATMLDALEDAVKSNPHGRFLGHRPIDKTTGDALDYVWATYAHVLVRIRHVAAGLQHERLVEVTTDGERPLCVYMKNRPEWVVAQYAAYMCGGFPVALYDTLGENSTAFVLNQTLASTVVCSAEKVATIVAAKPHAATLKALVIVDSDAIEPADKAAAEAAGLRVYSFDELEGLGAKHGMSSKTRRPSAADIYCLVYTSGTTGTPKGVPISHQNILFEFEGLRNRFGVGKGTRIFTRECRHLSFLPLAHCMEHSIHTTTILAQGCIGFYQGNPVKLLDDLVLLRPTVFGAVPRLLNRIYDKIVHGARAAGGFKAWLFDVAVQTKLDNLRRHGIVRHALFDALVFSKVLKKVGLDECCLVASGSAPLAEDVMDFFRIMFDCPIFEGYGQSEATAVTVMTHISDLDSGNVGIPLITCHTKLVSVPDLGYNVTDTTHGDNPATRIAVAGRGEICFRGPTVFTGYYKDPERTADVFDTDGWLHSGDIGVWTLDGRLKIVDRKKNIFKLSQGEYIAPEKVENILVASPCVVQSFVYGDSLHSVLVAIVVPDEDELRAFASMRGEPTAGSFEELCANTRVVNDLLESLTELCKSRKLLGFEIPKAVKLHPTPFTADDTLTTPTFKLKRAQAKRVFGSAIHALYEQCGDRVAGRILSQR